MNQLKLEEAGLRRLFYDTPTEELLIGRRALEEIENVTIQDDFKWDPDVKMWVLHCLIHIKNFSEELVPEYTSWFVLINDNYPLGDIKFYPSKKGGLCKTFPHQNYNSEGNPNKPWRTGDLCLNTDVRLFRRLGVDEEPQTPEKRLLWHFLRVLQWLESASSEGLLQQGDPFELPYFPLKPNVKLAFKENVHTLNEWHKQDSSFGYIEFNLLDNDIPIPTLVVEKYLTKNLDLINERKWGMFVDNHSQSKPIGAWILLPEVPVLKPWHAPSTWGGLSDVCSEHNVDLMGIIQKLAPKFRDGGVHILSIGFPIPNIVGGEVAQVHWVAIQLPIFTNKQSLAKGFRTKEKGFWWHDRNKSFQSSQEINWIYSENWDKKEITRRGSLSEASQSSKVLIIGAGAIGSILAEQLVRAGQHNMTIMDRDILTTGNLVRHTLTMEDIGKNKAQALAERLANTSPHAQIQHIKKNFPLTEQDEIDMINTHDVILDCTGENDVIYHISKFNWASSKTFISVSLGYGAKHLFLYLSSGVRFPGNSFFKLLKPWMENEQQLTKGIDFPREGIGCWHPVFPARIDDIYSMVSTGMKNIEFAMKNPLEKPKLIVYEEEWDGDLFLGIRLKSQEEYHE